MRFWTLPVLASLWLVAVNAVAEQPARDRGGTVRIGRSDVVRRAEAKGPGTLVARAGDASAVRIRDAADTVLSLPPRVELEVARHSYPGGSGMDLTATLWQDFSLGGLGAAKQDVARAMGDVRSLELELARRQAVHGAMLAWIDAWHGRALFTLRQQSSGLAAQLVSIAESRLRAGAVPPVELSLAQSVLGSARASLLEAEGRVADADARLRHALGLDPGVAITIEGDLTRSDDGPIDERAVLQRVKNEHPLVKLALATARHADARAELDASRGRPTLGLGIGYTRETTGDRMVGAMISLPLPIVNPSALEVSTGRADADMARMRAREVAALLLREARVALHDRVHARQLRAVLRTGSLAPGRLALEETIKRYERGDVGLAETLTARRELLAVEEAHLAACADVHRADAHLVYVAGALRSTQPPPP